MKTRYLLLVLCLVTCAGVFMSTQQKASAAFQFYGRAPNTTYYANDAQYGYWLFEDTSSHPLGMDTNYTGISRNWPTEQMTADLFISEIRKRLNSPVPYNQARTSAVINMMMGIDATDRRYDGPSANRWENGVAVARRDFAIWEQRIRDYDAAGRVEWNDLFSPTTSPYDWLGTITPGDKSARHNDVSVHQIPVELYDNDPAITFYNPDGTSFTMLKKCANLTGEVSPLIDLTPPTILSCGAMTPTPLKPELGDTIVVRPTVRYSGGPPTAVPSASSIVVRGPSGQVSPITASAVANNGTVRMESSGFTVPSSGEYTVTWSVTVNEASITCGGTFTPADSFVVLAYPFVRVNGGDTVAGASFSAPTPGRTAIIPCADADHNPNAGIVSSNRNTQPDYTGAGGRYAVFAMNVIQSYATDQGSSRPATSLSFSNIDYPDDGTTSVQASSGRFGGLFGKAPCVDYWGAKPDNNTLDILPSGSMNSLSGQYRHAGNLTIGNTNVLSGNRLTVYVEGDVNITGDIKFQDNSTSYSSTADIPSFRLIVSGRIFIENTVEQLDGLYVAVPNSNYTTASSSFTAPAAGTISTCSAGFTSFNPQVADMIGQCGRQLTVNGSVMANQMLLLRTFGTVRSNQPAEVFNYTPELWLAPQDSAMSGTYDSMKGLPPIL